eukprot:CAMPEP_0178996322 /NCGR_PEP_ID=MMETSP0795-20121207/8309_1 /TAXON_ID=88552 /ORGANISM="Amoebophrya sp., Strain Ameob2" /LENGTH=771 /DNA_ID=CAMNT_0020688709 /DNA_START=474 /DNA_END=2789 /DNA_ORIENTATION=+
MTAESDIDLVCLVPRLPLLKAEEAQYAEAPNPVRAKWVVEFGEILRKDPRTEDYVSIDSAANPTLCCKWKGVDLDIMVCCLPRRRSVEADFMEVSAAGDNAALFCDDSVLAELDDASQRSMNGVRVARLLLSDRTLIPDVSVFKTVLRFVKAWAKARAIYNNISGYFGGITWALCVAKVVMERPLERDPEKLVAAFFEYFNEFDFDKNAVLLRAPQTIAECLDPLAKQHIVTESVWTTKKETEVMAVVTPCFPAMNSCHNVNHMTATIIEAQFLRARGIVQRGASDPAGIEWQKFFEPLPFFEDYDFYLRISVEANGATGEEVRNEYCKLKGAVEARLRLLVCELAAYGGVHAHMYPFDVADPNTNESTWFIALDLDPEGEGFDATHGGPQKLDLRNPIGEWVHSLAYEAMKSTSARLHCAMCVKNETARFRRKLGEGPAISAGPTSSPSGSSSHFNSTTAAGGSSSSTSSAPGPSAAQHLPTATSTTTHAQGLGGQLHGTAASSASAASTSSGGGGAAVLASSSAVLGSSGAGVTIQHQGVLGNGTAGAGRVGQSLNGGTLLVGTSAASSSAAAQRSGSTAAAKSAGTSLAGGGFDGAAAASGNRISAAAVAPPPAAGITTMQQLGSTSLKSAPTQPLVGGGGPLSTGGAATTAGTTTIATAGPPPQTLAQTKAGGQVLGGRAPATADNRSSGAPLAAAPPGVYSNQGGVGVGGSGSGGGLVSSHVLATGMGAGDRGGSMGNSMKRPDHVSEGVGVGGGTGNSILKRPKN